MPIYNVEEYLAETVESILAQTMDFESNCQIVFVNDGSPDNSEEVCLRYQQQFPKNIKYIKQTNQGVSAARNRGIKEVEGKYISFLDSDDKLSPDTLCEVYDFFEKHQDKIDVISIKLITFDAYESQHPLNFKYDTSRVVDINQEPESVQLSGGSAFVKTAALKGKAFDTKLVVTEDAKLLTEIILERQAYGVLSEPVYWYRKRQEANSAISSSQKNKKWYLESPEYAYRAMMDYSQDKLGFVHRYVQSLVMYDLQWRFRQVHQNTLTDQELDQYKHQLYSLLNNIDDDIILAQHNLTSEYKLFILGKKHELDVTKQATRRGLAYYLEDQKLYDFEKNKPALVIEFFEPINGRVALEGYLNGFLFNGVKLLFEVGDKYYEPQYVTQPQKEKKFLGELVYGRNCFKVEVPLRLGSHIRAHLIVGDSEIDLPIVTKRFSGFSWGAKLPYRIVSNLIVLKTARSFKVEAYSRKLHIKRELKFIHNLASKRQWGAVFTRLFYRAYKLFVRRRIWLISDRANAAGDNGEAFFRYVSGKAPASIKPFFVISSKSPDHHRLRRYGKVISRSNFLYKLRFLAADKVISSHAEDYVINAFATKLKYVNDLLSFDFVFLQHGIICNDLSAWLNKYNKSIDLFVTSANSEHRSILSSRYGYTKNTVKLTGLARYDYLDNAPKGKLIIAPTWRQSLVGHASRTNGLRDHHDQFKLSEYFQFYQRLIQDERLIKVLAKHRMTGEFYLHPSFASQIKDFTPGRRFTVQDIPYDYKTAFKEGSLLVTDYSSVAFDFAYLKKPVIYSQFDQEVFYSSKVLDPGYFSYENDGFGPVVKDYNATVDQIIKSIESGCQMAAKYQKRVDNFFAFNDQNNNRRIYKEIQALDAAKHNSKDHIVFLGCGTGRSGTVSLAKLMTRCGNFYCTHEQTPLLPWEFDEELYQYKKKVLAGDGSMGMGDVHSVYLPYLERFIEDLPNIKIVCTERDAEEVAKSFEKKIGSHVNHWYDHQGKGNWQLSPKWDPTFPKYDIKDRHQAILQYVEDYGAKIRNLKKHYPQNILIVDINDLSTKSGQDRIFDFVGIKKGDRRYIDESQSVHNRT